MFKFSSKVILITGSSSGYGAVTAKAFARQKAHLALTGRDSKNLEKVAKECEEMGASGVLQVIADLEKIEDIENLVRKTIERFGKLDILINNAGKFAFSTWENMNPSQFDQLFHINVKAPMKLCQLTVPYLEKTKGNIINISSIVSGMHYPGIMLYSTTKAALDKFTKLLALEIASKGIRVNSVNASVSPTKVFDESFSDENDKSNFFLAQAKLHILGQKNIDPEEVVDAILHLASDSASAITGTILHVDRGRMLTGH